MFEPHVPKHVEASLASLALALTWRQKESRHSPSLAWTRTGLKSRRPNVGRVTVREVAERM